jgi:TIR domain/Pentapeptide repeats (8 copies)
MAKKEHLNKLKEGVAQWNAWRQQTGEDFRPDLSGAKLSGGVLNDANLKFVDLMLTDLSGVKMTGANLRNANLVSSLLIGADLRGAYLADANLSGANLSKADLFDADLTFTSLRDSNLTDASLVGSLLRMTILHGANLTNVSLSETVFEDVDLSHARGLDSCSHGGPSTVDHRTLVKSGTLPLTFLRGVGLPDALIDYLPSLLNKAIQLYSSFISYSTHDQHFADRLYADLQNKGVRCWFAPYDMPIGGKILHEIDAAIRQRDKVVLILSKHSIASGWIEDEVTKAFEEERRRGQDVLFPIRLDDAVMETDEAWAAKLRARHIGDFRRWKDHDAYTKAFERVLRDLRVKEA